MVDIVIKKLSPEEYGELVTLKKKKEYGSWKKLVVEEVLEKGEKNE